MAKLETQVSNLQAAYSCVRKIDEDYSDMLTNQPLIESYAANLAQLGRRVPSLHEVPAVIAGSTDMGNVSKLVPSIHPMIAAAPPTVPLHSIEFAEYAGSAQGHRAVIDGAKGGMFRLQFGNRPMTKDEIASLMSRLQKEKIVSLAVATP